MVKHPKYGYLVTTPSTSPEHGYTNDGSSMTAGCTLDNQIAFDALNQALLSAKELNCDSEFCDSLQNCINQLAPMQIGQYNQLQEWLVDADNPKDEHRHVSHLYGLYPSNQISPFKQPLLFESAKNTLNQLSQNINYKCCNTNHYLIYKAFGISHTFQHQYESN